MKQVFYLCLSWLGTFLFPAFLSDQGISFSYSHLALLFMLALYSLFLYTDKLKKDKRMDLHTRILGLLLSLMTSCGYYLETVGAVPYTQIKWVCSILVYAEIYSHLIQLTWFWLQRTEVKLSQAVDTGKLGKGLFEKVLCNPFLLMVLFLICWMPCYLANFPGFFYYDAASEFAQSVKGYSAEFPMLHSVLIIGILKIGYLLTGSYNTGIAFYVIAQMLLLSALFSHILCRFRKDGKSIVLVRILAVYFALFPLIHVLVTTTVRDVLFSGLLTYLVFQVYELAGNPGGFFSNSKKSISLGLTITFTIFARSNFAGMIPVLCISGAVLIIWIFGRKRVKKGLGKFCVSLAASHLALSCILLSICAPLHPSSLNQSLSFFTQPIARAYYYESENWTEDQRARFAEYFQLEGMKYVPENADKTKSYCTVDENTIGPFLRFWLSMGLRYPEHYLDGILAHALHMWFPGSPVDGYIESGDWGNEKSFFFVLDDIEEPGTHRQWFPGIRAFYRNLGFNLSYEKIPVVSMLFSIGFHFWFTVNAIFYLNYRKLHYACAPLLILIVYAMITALSPLVYLRYYGALFMAFPITVILTMQPGRKQLERGFPAE